ncbi:cation:proton antiporter [Ruminococcus sp.]|uniref:cation:proton antiporter n=1 Tax=Ruminococcus sp. TaxID=41978 RepID=UPI0025CD08B0|nr:cation:proton antiporter [Ruminococcus sp.]MBQ8965096.1 cation:proton antiporter [Ruminococcus sp.]
MKAYEILMDIALIIISAKFMGLVARKVKAPMVVGEIVAGIIVGPCLLGLVEPSEDLSVFAEIGVILIMFSAGLETNLQELKKSGLMALVIACVGVFVPLAAGTGLYMAFYGFGSVGSEKFFKALFIGCIMTATSVGITVEALKEMGYLKGRVGQTILSAAIIDDIIGIVVLTFVLSMKDPSADIGVVSLKVVGFLAASFILGFLIYKIFKVVDEKYPHTRRIPIIALSLCFVLAYVAEEYFGIADITGAYIAGIILCNVRDADYIDRKVNVNGYMFFAPIFFVGIGLKTSFKGLNGEAVLFCLAFVAVAMLSKLIGCGLVSKCFKFKNIDCIKIGAGMMTRGEVALIITNKGLSLGVIEPSISTAVILLIIVSSVVTPILLKYLYSRSPDPAEETAA